MKTNKMLFTLLVLGSGLLSFSKPLTQEFAHIPNIVRNAEVNQNNKIKNVILFIGDGMGLAHIEASAIYKNEKLSFQNFPYQAFMNTDSLSSIGFTLDESKSLIRPEENKSLYDGTPSPYGEEGSTLGTSGVVTCYTDSAAGGTALSTGEKVNNSTLGLSSDGSHITNIVEIAKGLGKKAGVVSSDIMSGATPSSFTAHADSRHTSIDIINSISESPVDLYMTSMDDTYKNNQSTLETTFRNKGFNITYSRNEIKIESNRILGLFNGVTWKSDPRVPSLAELTGFALDYLDNDKGFFLMVEGANIDKNSHSHQSKLVINETLGLDSAVNEALNWASNRDDTLILVTADHETGGLHFDRNNSTKDNIVDNMKWLSWNHSRTRVPLYIYGNITNFINQYSSRFSTLEGLPYWDNTDVFRFMSMYL